jgi:hypothetical protein
MPKCDLCFLDVFHCGLCKGSGIRSETPAETIERQGKETMEEEGQ